MKTMSVVELDQHWEIAAKALREDREIVVTRDGEAVARLLPVQEGAEPSGKRFDPEEHRRWMKKMWGDQTFDTLTPLMEDREDRNLISESALAALDALDGEEEHSADDAKASLKYGRGF